MNKYVFINSENVIKGVCTADHKLTADEVYPNMNYSAIQVDDVGIINNFAMYEFDGADFRLKEIPVPPPPEPTEVEILQQTVADLESQNTDLMLAIAEMAEATEQSKTETQLAIAELAEIIAGGA